MKPIMGKLRQTLVGSGGALAVCVLLLAGVLKVDAVKVADTAGPKPRYTEQGIVYSPKVTDLSALLEDDELAAEEAAAAVRLTQLK